VVNNTAHLKENIYPIVGISTTTSGILSQSAKVSNHLNDKELDLALLTVRNENNLWKNPCIRK